jgi:hypothetical protein
MRLQQQALLQPMKERSRATAIERRERLPLNL